MECPRCRRTIDTKTRKCAWCGVSVPSGQHLLEESGVVVPFPEGDSAGGSSKSARLATLGDRLIATILDAAILLAACAVIDVWAFMKWGVVAGAELRVTAAAILLGGSLNLVITFLYAWLLEASLGSTLGKAIVGIGVVNNSGRNSLGASAIRNLLRVVDGLGFYLLGALVATCSKFRRRIGDFCAGTYVVEGNLSELTRSLAVLGWLALLTGGAWALPRLCARPKPLHAPQHFGEVVLVLGRADKSIYMQLPNHRIDLSMNDSSAHDNIHAVSDPDSGKASKLESPESLPVLP
jgi:uncharacterized RDD family membrane protein YckC